MTECRLRLVSDYLKHSVNNYPDNTAFVFNNQRISYKEFCQQVEIMSKYLLQLGVKRHTRIAYLLETQPEFFCLVMAAARIGAIVVGLGTRLMPPELEYIIKNSEAEYIFASGGDRPYLERLNQVINNCSEVKQVIAFGNNTGYPNFTAYDDVLGNEFLDFDAAVVEREAEVDIDDGLLMVYTSGTTGKPKGALLSHHNIIHSCLIEVHTFKSTPHDIWLNNMPVNHVGGAIVQGITPLFSASTLVLMDSFRPAKTLELIQSEKVTILGGVPTMYAMEFNLPDYDKYDKSSLRIVHFGGSMAPISVINKVASSMTSNIYNCLGMTEAAGIVTYTPPGLNADLLSKTLGKVIPGIEWKLVDANRKTVQRGEVGELAFRGNSIIKEYYKSSQATDAYFDDDGWFYGGDLFYEDEDGLLILMGRKKEMFITGGENVYPAEVEEAIYNYGKVEAVAVISVPDSLFGEIGYAFIVPKADCKLEEAELKDYLKRNLAKYKIPDKFIFTSEMPLNANGKIAKKELKQKIA